MGTAAGSAGQQGGRQRNRDLLEEIQRAPQSPQGAGPQWRQAGVL